MTKKLTLLSTLLASTLLFTACGSDKKTKGKDPMSKKNYIVIMTEVVSGICESAGYKHSVLTELQLTNAMFRETANNTSCQSYGKTNNGIRCEMIYVGGGNKNCVIGFDNAYEKTIQDINHKDLSHIIEITGASF